MTSLNDSNKNLFLVNSMEPQLKFFGLFNNKEFAQINKEFIERLVLSGVFNKNDHYKGDVEFLNDYKIDSNGFSQLYSFDIRFSFEDNFYELTDEFIDELFNVCKHYVENVSNYMIENEINNYYYEIKKYLNKKEKIKFLEKKYQEVFPNDNLEDFAIFRKEDFTTFNDANKDQDIYCDDKNWREYFESNLIDFPQIARLYLTLTPLDSNFDKVSYFFSRVDNLSSDKIYDNKYPFYLKIARTILGPYIDKNFIRFIDLWKSFYVKNSVLNLISIKIKEIEKGINKRTQNDTTPSYLMSLKEWFSKEKNYELFIKKLIKDGIIDLDFNILIQEDKGFKPLRMKAGIGYLLLKNNWLKTNENGKPISQKTLCELLNNTFTDVNCDLSESNYCAAKKTFDKMSIPFNKNYKDCHLDKLHFIK